MCGRSDSPGAHPITCYMIHIVCKRNGARVAEVEGEGMGRSRKTFIALINHNRMECKFVRILSRVNIIYNSRLKRIFCEIFVVAGIAVDNKFLAEKSCRLDDPKKYTFYFISL
jgi:hypothetical protein